MTDNRSQDIKQIKLAIKVEKDALQFFGRFLEKLGESSLTPFLQQIHGLIAEDLGHFEETLQPLQAGQEGDIDSLSLDSYAKESTRGEKFFPPSRAAELLENNFNPIQVLGVCARIMKDLGNFYNESANNIFYEKEKSSFLETAERKKVQSESMERKKKELISRFP